MVPVACRVAAREEIAPGTVSLTVGDCARSVGVPAPGQFNMLWAPGVGEVPISLAGRDGDDVVHVIKAVGAVTRALCALQPGDALGLRGPFGTGWDLTAADGHDVLIIAGGLGLVPLRPLIGEIVAHRARFGSVGLIIGARSPSDLLFAEEFAVWGAAVDLEVTVDHAPTDWTGRVGVVTQLVDAVSVDHDDAATFICGPEVMMRFAAREVLERGTPADRIQVSMERNMHCGIGHCGRCQLGPVFLCREGPVVPWARIDASMKVRGR